VKITTIKTKTTGRLVIYTEKMSDPAIRKILRDVEIETLPAEERSP